MTDLHPISYDNKFSTKFSGQKLGNYVIPESSIEDTTIYFIPFLVPDGYIPTFIKYVRKINSSYYISPLKTFENDYIYANIYKTMNPEIENWWTIIFELSDKYSLVSYSLVTESPEKYYLRIISHKENLNIDIGIIPNDSVKDELAPLLEVISIPIVDSDSKDLLSSDIRSPVYAEGKNKSLQSFSKGMLIKDSNQHIMNGESYIINKYLYNRDTAIKKNEYAFIAGINNDVSTSIDCVTEMIIEDKSIKNIYLTLRSGYPSQLDEGGFHYSQYNILDIKNFYSYHDRSELTATVYANITLKKSNMDNNISFIILELDNNNKLIPIKIPMSKYQSSCYKRNEMISLAKDNTHIYIPGFLSDSPIISDDILDFKIIIIFDHDLNN